MINTNVIRIGFQKYIKENILKEKKKKTSFKYIDQKNIRRLGTATQVQYIRKHVSFRFIIIQFFLLYPTVVVPNVVWYRWLTSTTTTITKSIYETQEGEEEEEVIVHYPTCDPNALKYLNRLSDFLFVSARWVNYCEDYDEIEYVIPNNNFNK